MRLTIRTWKSRISGQFPRLSFKILGDNLRTSYNGTEGNFLLRTPCLCLLLGNSRTSKARQVFAESCGVLKGESEINALSPCIDAKTLLRRTAHRLDKAVDGEL
jgi:hypothetical protein